MWAMKTKPDPICRMSISLPQKLCDELDVMLAKRRLPSRSRAISEMIRNALAQHAEEKSGSALISGTITLVYRSDFGTIRHRIAQKQRDYLKEVISAQHVFLEDDQSLEVLLVQGPAHRLQALCDDLRRVRGMQQVQMVTTTALLPPLYDHGGNEIGTEHAGPIT